MERRRVEPDSAAELVSYMAEACDRLGLVVPSAALELAEAAYSRWRFGDAGRWLRKSGSQLRVDLLTPKGRLDVGPAFDKTLLRGRKRWLRDQERIYVQGVLSGRTVFVGCKMSCTLPCKSAQAFEGRLFGADEVPDINRLDCDCDVCMCFLMLEMRTSVRRSV